MFSKKAILIISLSLIILLFIGSFVYFLIFKKPAEKPPLVPEEKTLEEILKDLTAPQGVEATEVSKEVIESLTAPQKGEVSEDIIESLTAPTK